MSGYVLRYGRSKSPIAWIVPDAAYPGMWRIRWPEGQISDMVNLTRAKDAGNLIAGRNPLIQDVRLLHWDPHEESPEAAPVRQTVVEAV